jgi:hypothetical protein
VFGVGSESVVKSMTEDNRDWRESAYLSKENWPEAIPRMGPKREYGPYPWGEIRHENPHGVDEYPHSHPAAASIGDLFIGDVCPKCGVPLKYTQQVVNINDTEGELHAVSPDENPIPCYHPGCWQERQATINSIENASLGDF